MNDELVAAVLARASADEALSEDARYLVLAALGGDEDLAAALDDPGPPAAAAADPPAEAAAPARAYLASITARGFRGIGEPVTLAVPPAPGLVVVSGRNGSGKSSLAEALEVTITGRSHRWAARQALRPRWRNLRARRSSVTVELAEEGLGATVVTATWPPDADLEAPDTTVRRGAGDPLPGLAALGWDEPMRLFRPLLAYEEIEAQLLGGTRLHETLDSILGLRELDDARARLKARHRERSEAKEAADKLRRALRPRLADLDDERAARAAELLRRQRPDLDAVAGLVTGEPAGHDVADLRQVAALTLPDAAPFAAATDRLGRAAAALAALERHSETAAVHRIRLLAAALAGHDEHGDGPCPLCAGGVLDAAWAAGARAEIARDGELATRLREARAEAEAALAAARERCVPPPSALDRLAGRLPGAADVAARWRAWAALGPAELAGRGAEDLEQLRKVADDVAAQARDEAARRQDAWQPVALELAGWLGLARRAAADDASRRLLGEARDWLTAHADEVRNDRLRPLAGRARRVWSQLRQESNVDLGAITLSGQGNRRRVEFTASLDGEDVGALEVMSQGELNALALSLFIPRAALPQSPFGFVVIDDPVQAMDPSKVDGLARVLAELAAERQVLVFTHDDRLPEAIRRLRIDARLVEITRDAASAVTLGETLDPAGRYLDDARAAASDRSIDPALQTRAVAAMCRLALEARCRDVWFAARLGAGESRQAVERGWADATGTRRKLALALHGDPGASLDAWVAAGRARDRQAAVAICSRAPHQGVRMAPHRAVDVVTRLVGDVAAEARRAR